jgi:hypothetical protein
MNEDIIKIIKCVEVIDNWGNVETYKNEDLYKLLTTPEDWSDDQTFLGGEGDEGTYYIDDLIGKIVWVGDYVFKVVENEQKNS